jgi:hypothetical protein
MTATLEAANEALRSAVRDRLDNTPKDDPTVRGYVTKPLLERNPAGDLQQNDPYSEWDAFTRQTGDGVKGEATTVAEQTLQSALEAVRDRHTKYGPPNEHFARTAALVNAAFGTSFSAADWALVMVLDKVARLRGPTPTTDGGVDIAGYGGCYEECRSRG